MNRRRARSVRPLLRQSVGPRSRGAIGPEVRPRIRRGRASSWIFLASLSVGALLLLQGLAHAEDTVAQAAGTGAYVGIGSIFHDAFGKTAHRADGSFSSLGSVYPSLQGAYRFGDGQWTWVPSVNYTFAGKSDADDGATRSIFALGFAGERSLGEIDGRIGTGLMFYTISGNGGSVELDNGNSKQKFFKPAYSSSSRVALLDLGIGKEFKPSGLPGSIRIDLDVWLTGLLSGRRAANFVAGVTYGI